MGSVGNQNPWSPYYNYKDCSLGLCSIYCPQFCYFFFPPPPPPDNDDATPFSPLIIAVIGVLACSFILVSYYTIVTRYCKRGSQNTGLEADEHEAGHDQWQVSSAGLDEAIIKTIAVCTYKKGEGLIEGTECAVCLSEFQENESLRLLPKCSHAFHLPCIDTWLKSHSNCPLCRANVAPLAQPLPSSQGSGVDPYEIRRPDDLMVVVDDHGLDCCEEVVVSLVGGVDVGDSIPKVRESVGEFRRSVSLGAFPSHCRFMDEDLRVEKDQSVAMKRSSSTGRFMFIGHDQGKNFLLPH